MRDEEIVNLALEVADAALHDRGEVPADIIAQLQHIRCMWVRHMQSRRRVSAALRRFAETVRESGIEMPAGAWRHLYAALDWIRENGEHG